MPRYYGRVAGRSILDECNACNCPAILGRVGVHWPGAYIRSFVLTKEPFSIERRE